MNRKLRNLKYGTLAVVAVIGAALSYSSLYEAARVRFTPSYLAYGFPLLVDLLIMGALAAYVHGVKNDRPQVGWRLTAHAGVAGTMVLNYLAAPGDIFHLVAPAVWSVLCELTAREVLGERRAIRLNSEERSIPVRLWLSAPIESVRTWLILARLNSHSHIEARLSVGIHAAAREALRTSVEDPRVRRVIQRQLRAGSLAPGAVLAACGWTTGQIDAREAQDVLRAALGAVLTPSVPAAATPDSLGERPPSVPGQGQEAPKKRPAKVTKRQAVELALERTGGDVKAAVEYLSSDLGITVSETYAYSINRTLLNPNSDHSDHTVIQLRK